MEVCEWTMYLVGISNDHRSLSVVFRLMDGVVCGIGWLRGLGCGSYYVVLGFRMVLWFMVCVAGWVGEFSVYKVFFEVFVSLICHNRLIWPCLL